VLRFNRQDWQTISTAALAASSSRGHGLQFPDQDALNLIFGSDYLRMSYRWNFPSFFLNYVFQDLITPSIYHFMSSPRPWDGAFRPWGKTWHNPYLKLTSDHPELARFHKSLGLLKFVKYAAPQRIKRVIEMPLWSLALVRERISRSEAEA
jgi:lipopolysaccharide biosynthesis glycosyltransferase